IQFSAHHVKAGVEASPGSERIAAADELKVHIRSLLSQRQNASIACRKEQTNRKCRSDHAKQKIGYRFDLGGLPAERAPRTTASQNLALLPGLTRQSIFLAKKMDSRVMSAGDAQSSVDCEF